MNDLLNNIEHGQKELHKAVNKLEAESTILLLILEHYNRNGGKQNVQG